MICFNRILLMIIGVLEEKGESIFGQDQDDFILVFYIVVQKCIFVVDYL